MVFLQVSQADSILLKFKNHFVFKYLTSRCPVLKNSKNPRPGGLVHSFLRRNNNEFETTLTELSAMAPPASMGESSQPVQE